MNRKKREQLILDAGLRVFAREGYANTSVSQIIDEADVARGTFYLYFKGKEEIFNNLVIRFLDEVTRGIGKIDLKLTSDVPQLSVKVGLMRTMSSELVSALTKNKLLVRILLLDAHHLDQSTLSRLNTFQDQLVTLFTQQLGVHIQEGLVRHLPAEVTARCLMGSMKELLLSWIMKDHFEIEAHITGFIEFALGAILPIAVGTTEAMNVEQKKPATAGLRPGLH